MAKKKQTQQQSQTLARIKRTEAYAERVRTLFAATVNEILTLNKTLPTLDDGEMFSFDNESLKKQKEVERLLRQLHSVATMAIEKGIRLEWAAANAECDKLVQSCFGKRALETPEFTAWTQRNETAMSAFISRSERGLNLSQRVWKSCRQLRDEMEVAITVAIGDGTSAASMSRSVRKYLNDPDLMFRRFRYKAGEEKIFDEDGNEIGKKIIWGKKWKKRIRKSDGTVGWIDYDKDSYRDEWTGPGYYKSSAQNAMRVARTETNIAYRRADQARWEQMDFVLGQRVQMSKNHPKEDICDKLAGDYPPDFVFDGWHPQCFCFVTPILMDEDEIQKMNEAMLNGEEYVPKGKRITQYPENFKQWVRDNAERITSAHDTGTDPYFVRNNFNAVQHILDPEKTEAFEAQRAAQEEARIKAAEAKAQTKSAEQIAAEKAEKERVQRINSMANNVLKTATSRFDGLDIDTSELEDAIKLGNVDVINTQARALAKLMSEKQKTIRQTANTVVADASKYKDTSGSADVFALSTLMKNGGGTLAQINAQSTAIQKQIDAIKKKLTDFSKLLYDVDDWAQKHTVAELEGAYNAVEAMYTKHKGEDLKTLKGTLEFEANWKHDHPKYSTDAVVEQAYRKRLAEVEEELKWQAIKQAQKDYQTKLGSTFPTLIQELNDAVAAKDFTAAEAAVARLKPWDKVFTERATLSSALGASNAHLLNDVDNAIRAKDLTTAEASLSKLGKMKDIIVQRGVLANSIGAAHPALFAELDDAISKVKPIVAKKALDTLTRWSKVIDTLKMVDAITPKPDDLNKLLTQLKQSISAKNITQAEKIVDDLKKFTMSALELYCDKHYTEEFTVNSQDTYEEVMESLGKQTGPVWQAAKREQKQAFTWYTNSSSNSRSLLTTIGNGKSHPKADLIDSILDKITTAKDMVLRSGQDYDVARFVFGAEFEKLLQANDVDALNAKFAGTIGINTAYMSTSFNKEGGFTKQFEFHIFAPKGTHCINVNEISGFGRGRDVDEWDGADYSPTWYAHGETEIFLHRNIKYKFIRAELGTGLGGRTRVYVQLLGQ